MKTLLFIVSVGTIGALAWRTVPDAEAGPSAGPPEAALIPQSPSPSLQVQEHVLGNGFTILLVEDHPGAAGGRQPVVSGRVDGGA